MEPTTIAKKLATKKEIILKRTLIIGAALAGLLVATAVYTAVKSDPDVYIIEGENGFTVTDQDPDA